LIGADAEICWRCPACHARSVGSCPGHLRRGARDPRCGSYLLARGCIPRTGATSRAMTSRKGTIIGRLVESVAHGVTAQVARQLASVRLSRPVNGPSPRWGEGRVRGVLRKHRSALSNRDPHPLPLPRRRGVERTELQRQRASGLDGRSRQARHSAAPLLERVPRRRPMS
jgi:hypothetical protein